MNFSSYVIIYSCITSNLGKFVCASTCAFVRTHVRARACGHAGVVCVHARVPTRV